MNQLNEEEECVICYEKLTNNIFKTCCGHTYHATCINRWKNEHFTCPICRTDITTADANIQQITLENLEQHNARINAEIQRASIGFEMLRTEFLRQQAEFERQRAEILQLIEQANQEADRREFEGQRERNNRPTITSFIRNLFWNR